MALWINLSNADVVVIAGDLNFGTKGIQWMLSTIRNIPVIYVLGNHEYYRGSYPKTLHKIVELSIGTNVHVLENKAIVIGDVTFHGTTLWTDFELLGDPRINGSISQSKMNDYKLIRRDPSYSKLRSIDTYVIHRAAISGSKRALESSSTTKNIVATHHAPSIIQYPKDLEEMFCLQLMPRILKQQS